MSRRKKPTPRGTQPGVPLSDVQKEQIFQLFLVTGNKSEVARRMKLADATVRNHLRKVANEADPEFQAARRKAHLGLSGKVSAKANNLIDSITPEDMKSGRFEIKDDDGNLVRVVEYGPSLMAKVTAGAILIDKAQVLLSMESLVNGEADNNALLLPGNVEALVSGIQGKVKSLTLLKMDMQQEAPDLSQRIQKGLEEAEAYKEVEVVDFEDLDGND